jgi:GxxExxY protein
MDAPNDLSGRVIGAAIEVHRALGPGFLESVYEAALAIEFSERGILFARQVPIEVGYKGQAVGEGRADFIVENQIILELKAIENLMPIHEQQLLSYLKATGHRLGLLINFNVSVLSHGVKRVINSPK